MHSDERHDIDTAHPFFEFLRDHCRSEPGVDKVILFGSRARGDSNRTSDFDIAVSAPGLSEEGWARFSLGLSEAAPTLCSIDLVRLEQAMREELLRHILSEGVVVYERPKKAG